MRKCVECGTELESGENFCSNCGYENTPAKKSSNKTKSSFLSKETLSAASKIKGYAKFIKILYYISAAGMTIFGLVFTNDSDGMSLIVGLISAALFVIIGMITEAFIKWFGLVLEHLDILSSSVNK